MSWAKLDDRYWLHPKITMAGNTAAGIFSRMLSYCGCFLTDGIVPSNVVELISDGDGEQIDRLEQAGLLRRLESGGVEISSYLDHNFTKAQVEANRDQRSDRARAAARARWDKK